MASRVSSIYRPGLLKNKCAIVTGGGTGIGLAITQELLHLGCNVMIASRKSDRLAEAAEKISSAIPPPKGQLAFLECNIRKEDQVERLITDTLSRFGQLNILINNGGGQFISPVANMTLKGWNAVIETNLTGTFLMCKTAYNKWMRTNGGAIVNITATMHRGMPGMGHSGAARAGVENLSKTLATEWASAGVNVNCVCPGVFPSKTAADNYGFDVFSGIDERTSAKRLGNTEEVAAAVCYLVSPAAAYVTGETIKVDGGMHLYGQLLWDIPDHKQAAVYSWDTDNDDSDITKPTSKL